MECSLRCRELVRRYIFELLTNIDTMESILGYTYRGQRRRSFSPRERHLKLENAQVRFEGSETRIVFWKVLVSSSRPRIPTDDHLPGV